MLDLRLPAGLFFAVTGLILTVLGIMEPSITFTATSTALNPFPYGHILPGYGGADAFKGTTGYFAEMRGPLEQSKVEKLERLVLSV